MAMEKLRVLPLPLGFGFRPTEEEIFSNYLTRKVNGEKIDFDFIPEFDVSQHEPSEISSIFPGPKSDTLWHFFPTSEKKAYKGNRSTKAGYWKFVKESRCWQGDKHEGVRRTFTFYIGRRVGNNLGKCTAWIMHEYFMQDKDHIVLCRVTKRDKEYLTDADTSAPAEVVPYELHQLSVVVNFVIHENMSSPSENIICHANFNTNYQQEDIKIVGCKSYLIPICCYFTSV